MKYLFAFLATEAGVKNNLAPSCLAILSLIMISFGEIEPTNSKCNS